MKEKSNKRNLVPLSQNSYNSKKYTSHVKTKITIKRKRDSIELLSNETLVNLNWPIDNIIFQVQGKEIPPVQTDPLNYHKTRSFVFRESSFVEWKSRRMKIMGRHYSAWNATRLRIYYIERVLWPYSVDTMSPRTRDTTLNAHWPCKRCKP